jgi:hypothetical protein
VECKLRCVNFRRVLDSRRAFRPAFRVPGISDDCYRSDCDRFGNTSERRRELCVHLGAPGSTGNKSGSADDKPEGTWERRLQAWEHLEGPATSLGAPRITVEQSRKNNFFLGNAADSPRNHRYFLSFNDF